jgi:crossover junction endodeoxyribonuclease RuvC
MRCGGWPTTGQMKILGVDPSLRSTGYGLIETRGPEMELICHGNVRNAPGLLPSRCLVRIRDTLTDLIQQHQPDVMAVEGLVYVQNTRIALTLGQVRGVAIAAGAAHGLGIYEYAPRKVKQAVTGLGSAGKTQVARMVKALLGLKEVPQADAADALALAICHASCCRGVQINPPKQI